MSISIVCELEIIGYFSMLKKEFRSLKFRKSKKEMKGPINEFFCSNH